MTTDKRTERGRGGAEAAIGVTTTSTSAAGHSDATAAAPTPAGTRGTTSATDKQAEGGRGGAEAAIGIMLLGLSVVGTLLGWTALAVSDGWVTVPVGESNADGADRAAVRQQLPEVASPQLEPIPELFEADTRLPARRRRAPDVVSRASRR